MKILIIGSGGREHAIAWKVSKSPLVSKIFCAPGNGGTIEVARNIRIDADDINGMIAFAEKEKIDLTIVGPELPLTLGIVDEFRRRGLKIFGADKRAAELEGSKVFAKEFLKKYNIPTAEYEVFDEARKAKEYIKSKNSPLVIKADGLAAGKGVILCSSPDEAVAAVNRIMINAEFGNAGSRIVVEEFLDGEEASILVITDGKNVLPLASSRDHKALEDGNKGPNTGGMGAISPAPLITESLYREILETIIQPTIQGMEKEDRVYRGVLYAGLMVCNNKPKVLEFNARFGDPETQPILLRMDSDIVPVFAAAADSTIDTVDIVWKKEAAACVVMASKGYPGKYEKGKEIKGLEMLKGDDSLMGFHAGTAIEYGKIVTGGGRVLGITALGKDLKESIERAYSAVEKVSFEGAYYRRDIGGIV